MKTYISLLLILFMSSCSPDLDLSSKSNVTVGTYYKTEADAKAAVVSMYSMLRSMYRDEVLVTPTTVAADDGIPFLTGNADRLALWNYNWVPTNTFTGNIWANAYMGIQRSNIILNRIPGISMDETTKKGYLGEARFLRAMHYFTLVQCFGGVPLVLDETTSLANATIARASVEDVYQQIETDLKEAESSLPVQYTGSDIGKATQGAAKGLLAKVYLTWAGTTTSSPYWALAAAKAKEVIDSGTYALWDNYADVFTLANRCGKESLFEVLYITDLAGNNFTTGYAPRSAPIVPGSGSGIFRVSPSLYASYSTTDTRKSVSFLSSFVNPTTQETVTLSVTDSDPTKAISFWKLADLTSTVGGAGGKSFPILRYSDILLIYAEALNEANNGPNTEAYAAVNQVRERAGLESLTGLNYQSFKEAVWLERRLEFCFEGQRWFDLVRTGRLLSAVKAETSFGRASAIQAYHVHMPIPQREIDANTALVQNEGY
ncbi:MAG: RagB/SusD family nutrient uptake outer membrane protein [Siphonobacter sp.]